VSFPLEVSLSSLLESSPVDNFLRACNELPGSSDLPAITILFPRFREDKPDIDALAEFLWSQAVNYVIPLRLRQRANEEAANSSTGGDLSQASRLIQRTRKTFIEFNDKFPSRASEVGELLAYLITIRHLNAFQIASKMALKTNNNMPVHGLDGIHARFANGIMTLYFLESKLAASAESGAEKYAESVHGFGDNRKQYLLEYEIIADLSNLDALLEDERAAALEYLDVYGPQKSKRLERSVGVICYTDGTLFAEKLPKDDKTPPDLHESALEQRLTPYYSSHRKTLAKALAKHNIDQSMCKVFLIAFPDVDDFRQAFYKVMNG
jgi:Cap4 SAVED domain